MPKPRTGIRSDVCIAAENQPSLARWGFDPPKVRRVPRRGRVSNPSLRCSGRVAVPPGGAIWAGRSSGFSVAVFPCDYGSWIPAPYRGTGHAFDRRNDEFGGGNHSSRIGVRDMLSYQSLVPAGAGTPRYEKPELWLGTARWHRGFCHAPPAPSGGQAPRATFSHSAIDHPSTNCISNLRLGKSMLTDCW